MHSRPDLQMSLPLPYDGGNEDAAPEIGGALARIGVEQKGSCGLTPQQSEGGSIDENHYISIQSPRLMSRQTSR